MEEEVQYSWRPAMNTVYGKKDWNAAITKSSIAKISMVEKEL